MLRLEAGELINAKVQWKYSLQVVYDGDWILDTHPEVAQSVTIALRKRCFVCFKSTAVMNVTISVTETNDNMWRIWVLSLSGNLVEEMQQLGSIEGSFPLTIESCSSDADGSGGMVLFINLKMDVAHPAGSFSSGGSDDVLPKGLDMRYEKLLGNLSQRASMSLCRNGSINNIAATTSSSLPSAPSKRSTIAPSASCKGNSQVLHFVRSSSGGVVLAVHVKVGDWIMPGTKLLDMTRDTTSASCPALVLLEDDDGVPNPQESSSVMYSDAAYEASAEALVADESFAELQEVFDAASSVASLTWNGDVPGVVDVILTNVGACVSGVDIDLIGVNVSVTSQQHSLLAALDKLAQEELRKTLPAFNARFQDVSDAFISCTISSSRETVDGTIECCVELEKVARDFSSQARTYGRVIISEMHLPLEMRSIRPLKLGGFLGGTKYIVRGILFKIPNGDMFTRYPDPMHMANKVQGHELKGLKAYFAWFFNRGHVGMVSFPLAAVIDFKGFRILAMTQLPLEGSKSLIYGSADAGDECHVLNEEPSWSSLVSDASVGLNLKPHWVINGRNSGGETEITSCVDLEGHRGLDKRFYLLDFSRTFPPAFRSEEVRKPHDNMWPYFHMLRQEFLSSWTSPLSADAFSPFQSCINEKRKEEAKLCNREVRAATEHLESVIVGQVCHALLKVTDWSVSLTHFFHRHGLNMRYLGLVYAKLVSNELYSRSRHHLYRSVLAEALMRALKNHLRMHLRMGAKKAQFSETGGDSGLQQEAALLLNKFFGLSSNVTQWCDKNQFVFGALKECFYFSEKHARAAVETFLSDAKMEEVGSMGLQSSAVSIKFVVLSRLNNAVGLGIPQNLLRDLRRPFGNSTRPDGDPFRQAIIFEYSDVNFSERIKNLDIVDRALALSQFLKGSSLKSAPSVRLNHLVSSFETLETALEGSPKDAWLNLLMADVCQAIWKLVSSENGTSEVSERARERAHVHYKLASVGTNVQAYRKYGLFLAQLDLIDEAETSFLLSLESCERLGRAPDEEALMGLIRVLERKGDTRTASILRDRAKSWYNIREKWISVNTSKSVTSLSSSLTSTEALSTPATRGQVALRKGTIRLGNSRSSSGTSLNESSGSNIKSIKIEPLKRNSDSSSSNNNATLSPPSVAKDNVRERSPSKLKKIGETIRQRIKSPRLSPSSSARTSSTLADDDELEMPKSPRIAPALSVLPVAPPDDHDSSDDEDHNNTAQEKKTNQGQCAEEVKELMEALERNRELLDRLKQSE